MPEAKSSRDIMAEVMSGGRQALVPMLAEMLKRDGIDEVDTAEERRRFWQRALTPEQEAQLWQQEIANRGITQMTPEQATDIGLGISKQVYPDRWDMMPGAGRDTEAKQAMWASKHAKLGPPVEKQQEGEANGIEG